jgi:hypothetical protein
MSEEVNIFAGNEEPSVGEGSWTDEEKRLFLVGLRKYGNGEWEKISTVVKTR